MLHVYQYAYAFKYVKYILNIGPAVEGLKSSIATTSR